MKHQPFLAVILLFLLLSSPLIANWISPSAIPAVQSFHQEVTLQTSPTTIIDSTGRKAPYSIDVPTLLPSIGILSNSNVIEEYPIQKDSQLNELLQNSNFDFGQWTPWQELGSPHLNTSTYYSPPYSVLLAGRNDADDGIFQSFSVPNSTQELNLNIRIKISSNEILPTFDWFCYDFYNQDLSDSIINGPYCDDLYYVSKNQWINGTVKITNSTLTPFLGEKVWLILFAHTDSSGISSVWVDNISISAYSTETTVLLYIPAILSQPQIQIPPTTTPVPGATPSHPPAPTATTRPEPTPTTDTYCLSSWVQCGIYCGFEAESTSCRAVCLQKYSYCLAYGVWP